MAYNTIFLMHGTASCKMSDWMESVRPGSAVAGDLDPDCHPIKRWHIDEMAAAKAELAKHRCTYQQDGKTVWMDEYALMLIEVDEDDEWGDEYDYIFSVNNWANYSRFTAEMPDIPRAMDCLPVWPEIPEDEMNFIRSVAGNEAKIYTAQDIKLYDGHLMLAGQFIKSDLIDAPFGGKVIKLLAAEFPRTVLVGSDNGDSMLIRFDDGVGKIISRSTSVYRLIVILAAGFYFAPDDTAALIRVILSCNGQIPCENEKKMLFERADHDLRLEYDKISDEEGKNLPDYSQYLYLAIENLEDMDDEKYCRLHKNK